MFRPVNAVSDHISIGGTDMRFTVCMIIVFACLAGGASIIHTIDAPDGELIGLAWQDGGALWAADNGSGYVYRLDPATGAVTFSFYPSFSGSYNIYGLGCSNDTLFVNYGKAVGGGMFSMYDCGSGGYLGNVSLC
jgi:hypothetical protein